MLLTWPVRERGRTAPNPPVGAVIIQDGAIVGEGYHPRAGDPHAEIFALRQAEGRAAGAEIYVTLEPCSHHGKTPPCADALIAAGIRKVFVGTTDPNPQVAGRGIERLRQAGIDVEVGILEENCRKLIAAFRQLIVSGRPLTIYKAALTLDGNSATCSGDSRWVSGPASRLLVHRLRDRVEAIMVGIETVLKDDPALTARLPETDGRDPLRVVVDSQLRIPLDCRMLRQISEAGTLVATVSQDREKIEALQQAGAEVIVLPEESGRVKLPALWEELGRRQVQRLLLEGGPTLASAALNAGLIDQLMIFMAPKLVGGNTGNSLFSGDGCKHMADALALQDVRCTSVDGDLLITGDVPGCLPD